MLEVQEVELSKLKPWEHNPRLNDQAVDAVAKSIKAFGFNVPILYDQNWTIIAGHTRWKAAKKLGMTYVPAIQIKMTDSQRKAFSIADNKTAEIADWDLPKLKSLLDELELEDINFDDLGFSDEDMNRLINELKKQLWMDEDEIPTIRAVAETRNGDLIQLGKHRLLCGDSRDRESIHLLVSGEKINFVFGGPPYYNQRRYSQWNNYTEYLNDMKCIINNCQELLCDGGVIVWNIANDCSEHLDLTSHHSRLLEESGLRYLDTIIWQKTSANYSIPRNIHITRNRCYYPALQWEALLVYQKPGKMPKMSPEGVQYMRIHHTNVWTVSAIVNQEKRYGHPAVCPMEIPYRAILAYTGAEAIIFEPFGGSGTTLIAAEKAGRIASLIEKDPLYCDTIIKRWEKITGKNAKLINRQ